MGIFDKKYRNKKQFLKGILPAMPIIVILMKEKGEKAIIVATEPLTKEEKWNEFKVGELKIFKNGEIIDIGKYNV